MNHAGSSPRPAIAARHASAGQTGLSVGRSRPLAAFIALILGLAAIVVMAGPSQAADPCVSGNAIACENSKTGNPSSEWEIVGDGSADVEGFTTDISVQAGNTVQFKIHSTANYSMNIYRMGYYDGKGARFITSVTPNQTVSQANLPSACVNNSASTGLVDCGTWGVSASWPVPANAVSGVYFAHIVQTGDDSKDNHVMFVVRNDSSHSDLVFQTSDTTWQAYNNWGGNSLYAGEPVGRAYKVSYNRPFNTRGTPGGRDFVWANEYPMIRFLEANGYDVSYISGVDTDRYGATLLPNHKTFLSVGHDEYWSSQQRANVEAARDAGVNLAFFSGNEVFWKTRYENSVDPSNTPYRTLVTYKESTDGAKTEASGSIWTGTWRDPRFSPPSDGGRPENALTGTIFTVNSGTKAIQVPAADGKMRFWRGTTVGSQSATQTATLPMNTLGYEWDEDLDNGFRPKGAIRMSTSNYDVPEKIVGYTTNVEPGNATHHLMLYRASSGALVFGAGTVQWSWGLDSEHDGAATDTDPSMRQATVNLLADMSAQPTTIQSGMSIATKSTDTTPAVAAITSPAAGALVANGSTVTVSGTATDVGGQVGGVEVSLDGGQTWHPAAGRSNWTYTGVMGGVGATTIQARASDDSANVQAVPTQRSITVSCPCSLFNNETPATASGSDTSEIELGVRFQSQMDGYVTGVKFYKGSLNTGVHTGTLWSNTGEKLATGTFLGETATGWQTLQFATAVHITAGTKYVASYHAPNGGYAATAQYFVASDAVSYPLTAPRSSDSNPNGVFDTGSSRFPTSSFTGGNYWVTPVFDTVQPPDTTPPVVSSVSPADASSSIAVTRKPAVTFSEPIKAGTLGLTLSAGSGLVSGSVAFDSERKVATFTPTAPLAGGTTYTLAVTGGKDDADNNLVASSTTFRTAAASTPGVCPCSIWSDSDEPTQVTVNDPNQVELGVRFRADQDGFISGIRFYKGPQNVGAHTGTLWNSTGTTQLATVTFSNESSSGWQEMRFSTKVPVTAGTTYVASYHTSGYYSASSGALAQAVVNSPLTALATGTDGANGLYNYGAHAFPGNSGGGTSYGVDVVFELPSDILPPAVSSTSPGAGADNVRTVAKPVATFNERVVSGLTATLKQGSTTVPSTVALDSTGRIATVTPGTALSPGGTYTVSLNGAKDAAGNTMTSAYSWSFTVSGSSACPCRLYSSDYVPAVTSANDSSALELGVRFVPSEDGFITGVRFYKGAGNTGTHTGSLWTTGGSLITTATFGAETDSGWQQVSFAAPVQVTAGTAYVASYSARNGHYAADSGQLGSAWANPPLTAPADVSGASNGVYSTTPGRFPNSSFNSTGYGVDVVFAVGSQSDTVPPSLVSTSPVDGATSVPTTQAPVATFNEALAGSSVQATLTGPGSSSVAATVTVGADRTVTVTPSAALAYDTGYTVRITGNDLAGNALPAAVTWSFRTAKEPTSSCPCSLWPDDATPALASDSDDRSIELGVKFSAATDGVITGVRFYKGPGNTGTHVGSLWSATGTELAQATFGSESAAGWQEVNFASPVSVTAGTTYVASYHAPNGGFAATVGGFAAAAVTRGPLTAPIGTVADPNGVYLYGSRAFPNGGTNTNYWVDVLFQSSAPTNTPVTPTPTPTPTPVPTTPAPTTPAPTPTPTPTPTPAPDTTPPAVTAVTSTGSGTTATVSWTTNEASTSVVDYGTSATALTSRATAAGSGLSHAVTLTGLTANTRYYFRVTSVDAASNSTTSPGTSAAAAQYAPTVAPITQSTSAEFAAGTNATTYVAGRSGGEVTLAPSSTQEFTGTTVPTTWSSVSLATGSTVAVASGVATVSGRLFRQTATVTTSRELDAVATLKPVTGQWLGLTDDDFSGSTDRWSAFRTTTTGALVAETQNGILGTTTTTLPTGLTGTAHRYEIDLTATTAVFKVDGVTVASQARGISVAVRPAVRDSAVDANPILLDSVWVTPYATSGTYTSAVVDAGATVDWRAFTPTATAPTGTTISYQVRTGPSATAGGTGWSAWSTVTSGGDIPGTTRYLQYRTTLTTSSARNTAPTVTAVQVAFVVS
jgi:hypothetical protein